MVENRNTWGACELALYLRGKHMQAHTAVQVCKELGAINIEDLRISVPEMYGELSLSLADKKALDVIRFASLKEAEDKHDSLAQPVRAEARVPELLAALAQCAHVA